MENRQSNCFSSEPDWSQFEKVKSDEKILIPVLTYGPNNQLRGFRFLIIIKIIINKNN